MWMTPFVYPFSFLWLIPFVIWAGVWKGIALWKAGRNNQVVWFVVMFLLNTLGILPILYLVFFQKKSEPAVAHRAVKRRPVKRKPARKRRKR